MEWSRALLDEIAFAGQEHLDPAYVAAYDHKAAFDPSDDLLLLYELGLGRESTLVDLGAGTGTLALAAGAHCRRVVAVDPSAEMVVATREKAETLGVANVESVQAGFLSYEHQGARVDFVYSRNALHHLPDFWKAVALERIAQILRPGGMLRLRDLVFAFNPGEAGQLIGNWLGSGAERPEDGFTRADFEAHLRNEFSTFSWLLEPMLERAGFEIKHADYGSRRIHAAYVCVKTAR
jgi:SAM-dependent methyltransferase